MNGVEQYLSYSLISTSQSTEIHLYSHSFLFHVALTKQMCMRHFYTAVMQHWCRLCSAKVLVDILASFHEEKCTNVGFTVEHSSTLWFWYLRFFLYSSLFYENLHILHIDNAVAIKAILKYASLTLLLNVPMMLLLCKCYSFVVTAIYNFIF